MVLSVQVNTSGVGLEEPPQTEVGGCRTSWREKIVWPTSVSDSRNSWLNMHLPVFWCFQAVGNARAFCKTYQQSQKQLTVRFFKCWAFRVKWLHKTLIINQKKMFLVIKKSGNAFKAWTPEGHTPESGTGNSFSPRGCWGYVGVAVLQCEMTVL